MPTICQFYGISIRMYFREHGPPHFHAVDSEGAASVRIDTLEVMESSLSRRNLLLVLAWAELHTDELLENWNRARASAKLQPIDPLR